ncbi:hypothetical protein FRB95_005141 [Tulasnella sp. JGI-2019a]|nr:hypothetical protein FRB95_005141 [Tulasnella sp. JGI-2019a]
MTITSPLEIRTQLASALGSGGLPYWRMLTDFLQGNIGRVEFEELVRRWINTSELVVLHNSLIFAILYKASHPVVVEVSTAPVEGPPKKKRKIIPHQDPPPQLQKWILGMGKAERTRVRHANANGRRPGHPAIPSYYDEVENERPVAIRAEGTCKCKSLIKPFNVLVDRCDFSRSSRHARPTADRKSLPNPAEPSASF